ncbi:unnamed protein product, partial [Rotaria sordida]
MRYFDVRRLYAPHLCILLLYVYNIAGIAIPFSFVTFTVHRFCCIVYHTNLFFKTKRWVTICIVSQWIGEFVISLPFLFRRGSYCSNELWMQIYTCMMTTFLPSLINTILNIRIFAYVRSSTRRIQPQVNVIPTNSSNNIQQPIISRWVPVYLITIIGYFVRIDPIILAGTAILSQL